MKRIKVVTIYHVADNRDEGVFADKLIEHVRQFRDGDRSRNDVMPHYESCEVSVERKTWEGILT